MESTTCLSFANRAAFVSAAEMTFEPVFEKPDPISKSTFDKTGV